MVQKQEKKNQINNIPRISTSAYACLRMAIGIFGIVEIMRLLHVNLLLPEPNPWFYLLLSIALASSSLLLIGFQGKWNRWLFALSLATMLVLEYPLQTELLVQWKHQGILLLTMIIALALPLHQAWSIDVAFQHTRPRVEFPKLRLSILFALVLFSVIFAGVQKQSPSVWYLIYFLLFLPHSLLDGLSTRYVTWLKRINQIDTQQLVDHHHEHCIGKACDLFEKCSEAKACVNDHHIFPIEYHKENCDDHQDLLALAQATNRAFDQKTAPLD
jgi:hypothetical protein